MELRLAAAIRRLLIDWGKVALSKTESLGVKLDEISTAPKRKSTLKALVASGQKMANETRFQNELERAASAILKSNASAQVSLGIKLRDKGSELDKLVKVWRKSATESIGSLLESEAGRLEKILAAGEGVRIESVAANIADRIDVTASKALSIARTEAARVNSQITEYRHAAAGIAEYIWTTSGDERVSDAHADLDGEQFSYTDPPTDSDGNTGHPGNNRPNCRCTAYPVIPD